jgi:hypothetical protein
VICILCHGAHAVGAKTGAATRLGTIFGYRKPDPAKKIVTGVVELPSMWQCKRDQGQLPNELAKMFQLF